MVIEFNTVRQNLREQYEKDVAREIQGDVAVSYENEHDYHARITIDMKRVADFAEGKVDYNENRYNCVYPLFKDGCPTLPLLCDYDTFKKAFEMVNDIDIQSIKDFE